MKETPQGYTYLPVLPSHIYNWGGLGVCDDCNQDIQQGYLVFILNRCICADCFNEWVDRANVYLDYLAYQEEHQADLHRRRLRSVWCVRQYA